MKPLNQFIQPGAPLDRLRSGARRLDALVRRIRAALPVEARDHVVGCAPHPSQVVVFVDTAAWASQLRYLQHDILDVCRQTFGEHVQRIRFKVMPPETPAGTPPVAQLSENARRLLKGAAGGVADDALAAALRRLSESGDQDAD